MYSSILSNIALNGSKTQFYFPFFCHSLRLLHLAWFVFKHKLLFWSPPTQEEVGHIFVRILSATMLVLAYHSPHSLSCVWARHFTPRKYWLITQEAMAPSRHDWKIVDWDVKPQHNQPTFLVWMHDILWTNRWLFGHIIGIVWRVFFLCFDDLDLIFKGTSYLKLSNLSPKVLVCMIFL